MPSISLRDGLTDLRERPLVERRARQLERRFGKTGSPLLRISDVVRGDGRALYERAIDRGWEGLIAKQADSKYRSGKRTPDWRKLKIVHEQEFVVGGWTEPRQTRTYFGALLLGVYDRRQGGGKPNGLTYVGHSGTGFNERELARVMALLKPLETRTCPFEKRPPSNETPYWARPNWWRRSSSRNGRRRQAAASEKYLGLRATTRNRRRSCARQTRLDAPTSVRRVGRDT